ncbi:bis(5'-nucleosyl)-tetraphosphatase (symmetrical) YqeK [Aerococcaceae bacterium DSM 111176]|nr:bis(5'-nucleosyl)-tetraphosphatase (symmetrical) YqeK [Aerococcaceae bacterium DSM 111176]
MSLNFETLRKNILKYVKEHVNPGRYQHTLRVEETAIRLANQYGADVESVRLAAVLHDACKDFESKKMTKFAKNFLKREGIEIDLSNAGTAILHGLAAADLGYRIYGIKDKDILYAVAFHTTGWYKMSLIGKIIFIADYIEPERNFNKVKKARKLANKDLDRATVFKMKNSIRHLAKDENYIYIESVKIYNHWISK